MFRYHDSRSKDALLARPLPRFDPRHEDERETYMWNLA